MRVAFYSVEGSTLSWQRRLIDEGCEVLVYQEKLWNRKTGIGIVPLASSRDEWLAWGLRDRSTLWFFDCTDAGELADSLRKRGCLVVGGGAFMDRLEADRPFGQRFAARSGVQEPPTRAFGSVRAALAHIKSGAKQQLGDGGWAWKSNRTIDQAHRTIVGDQQKVAEFLERVILPRYGDRVSAIVQERIKGVALSTAQWWNGFRFTGPVQATLERKGFMNDEKGPATGCALNLVWFYHERMPKIVQQLNWPALEAELRANGAPPGLYDINAIVARSGAYFLEWTPRLGIDTELTSQRAISNLSEMLMRLARGEDVYDLFDTSRVYAAVRLTVPPYPLDDKETQYSKAAPGVPISGADGIWDKRFVAVGVRLDRDGLCVADPFGFVGAAIGGGTSVQSAFAPLYAYLDKRLRVPNLQYRTDAVEAVTEDIDKMRSVGYGTTPILDDAEEVA